MSLCFLAGPLSPCILKAEPFRTLRSFVPLSEDGHIMPLNYEIVL